MGKKIDKQSLDMTVSQNTTQTFTLQVVDQQGAGQSPYSKSDQRQTYLSQMAPTVPCRSLQLELTSENGHDREENWSSDHYYYYFLVCNFV